MNLIDEFEKLRELERQAMGGPWCYVRDTDGHEVSDNLDVDGPDGSAICTFTEFMEYPQDIPNAEFICSDRNLAPAMLEVLGCFREGDADQLLFVMSGEFRYGGCDCEQCQGATKVLRRLHTAAALMEQEGRS